ncbi:hypothetical protein scyTo_0012534 [Scyliorhinus torazame]|uniref:Uncharacterized protein n=1 Tax=Scyliorhinus torazame TaxID=75743 RepID=A0A401PA89_SCYTO|nr:hypothetical protein [Scyliorhinus torazame]
MSVIYDLFLKTNVVLNVRSIVRWSEFLWECERKVPEVFAHTLISPISLAFHVSVLICFVAITVLLCQWKCQYPAK